MFSSFSEVFSFHGVESWHQRNMANFVFGLFVLVGR